MLFRSAEGIFTWNQKSGQNASTTGTIYGIYDMSGGLWEPSTAYIANGHTNLKHYGASIAYQGDNLKTASTKYTTVYPHNEAGETDINKAAPKNFAANTKIYGDAVRETTSSTAGTTNVGWNTSSWNSDYSYFPALSHLSFTRGGDVWHGSQAGGFAFYWHDNAPGYAIRFPSSLGWFELNS